ncbi:twin-arginine translocase subunit TatC [Corynebacterium bovis]|uniref:twin-arginine translocase subunit TatC n=1 Tax=Corynebacterium bovis TaxID=36808 RepID=UPI0021AB36F2|nr:twin-arginine translocase subunit TatC [Corynebacterium bovis]
MSTAPGQRRVRLPRRRKRSPDGTMSLVEHVKEFRRRLLISLAALAVGTVLGYIWYSTRVGPVPSLAEILTAPYCSVPAEQRFGSSSGDCRLLATSPFEMFILRLKVGALAGAVFSSPVWLTQIWGFITPGLKKNERRWTLSFVVLATLLFTAGAVLAYFILAYGLEFLLTIGDKAQIAALTGEKYFSFALHLLLIFGVSFEVPLITAMLNLAGILSYEQLRSKRRYIITVMFIFAAFATPDPGPLPAGLTDHGWTGSPGASCNASDTWVFAARGSESQVVVCRVGDAGGLYYRGEFRGGQAEHDIAASGSGGTWWRTEPEGGMTITVTPDGLSVDRVDGGTVTTSSFTEHRQR